MVRIGIVIWSTYLGIKAPEIFLSNKISKRQALIRRAWPDALDLLLICVESGMSIEQAFRRVSVEIGEPVGPARRGTHPDDGGTVLSAGAARRLRKSREPHGP